MFFLICAELEVKKTLVRSFYKENNFKPCLTEQLLNMFKQFGVNGASDVYQTQIISRVLQLFSI